MQRGASKWKNCIFIFEKTGVIFVQEQVQRKSPFAIELIKKKKNKANAQSKDYGEKEEKMEERKRKTTSKANFKETALP